MVTCASGMGSMPAAHCHGSIGTQRLHPSFRPFTAGTQPFAQAKHVRAHWQPRQSMLQPVAAVGADCGGDCSGARPTLQQAASGVVRKALAAGLAAAMALGQPGGPALAANTAAVGKCLLGNCPKELAACLADPSCVQNLACLQKCNGLSPEEESSCQVKCGDKFENEVVQRFNKCALSKNNCVGKRVEDAADWPVPPDDVLDAKFDLSKFTGRWYITAGLNPLFDTFPCQEHFFGVPEPGKLYGRINWRIPLGPKDDFLERTAIQTFNQQVNPAILFNHDNEYLGYTDDWYVLASRPNEYVLIYYKGNNDAWDGYGGATVYTRKPQLPRQYVPELRAALKKIGRDWDDFIHTDNSCRPRAAPRNAAADVARTFEAGVNTPEKAAGEGTIEKDLKSAGSKFSGVQQFLLPNGSNNGQKADKTAAQSEMDDADQYLGEIEKRYAAKRL